MFKLYKRIDGVLHYREGWQHEATAVEHWGVCGDRGEFRETVCQSHDEVSQVLMKSEKDARAEDFEPISSEEHDWLIVEFSLADFPEPLSALDFRHRLEDKLSDLAGWLGVGHCDGGSIGSGTLEAACPVVDFAVASEAFRRELAGTDFGRYSRIYKEDR